MSTVSFFDFKGLHFVAGLIWQSFPQDATKAHISQLAKEIDCDMMVCRNDPSLQYGFGSSEQDDGFKSLSFSAAAILSKSMDMEGAPGNVLAAFELPDGRFMLYAHRSHAILPLNGDMIGSEDEIYAAFNNQLSGGWDNLIAPSEWGIQSAVFRDFSSFVPSKNGKVIVHKWWALCPVDEKSKAASYAPWAALIAAALFALFYGYSQYENNQLKQKEAIRLALENVQREKDHIALAKNIANQAPRHPWVSMPIPGEMVRSCESALHSIPFSPLGWVLKSFSCTPESFSASYARQVSTSIELKRAYPEFAISADGESAAIGGVLKIECCGNPEDIIEKKDAYFQLVSFYQRFQLKSKIDEVAQPVAAQVNGVNMAQPDWTTYKWAIDVAGSPLSMISAIGIPGIRIEKMSFLPSTGGWSIEGDLYAKNH